MRKDHRSISIALPLLGVLLTGGLSPTYASGPTFSRFGIGDLVRYGHGRIDAMGGMLPAVHQGYPQKEIAASAFQHQRELEKEERFIVGVNRYQDVLWFNKEAFEELIWWLYVTASISIITTYSANEPESSISKQILELYETVEHLLLAETESGYQVEKLLEAARIL